MNIGIIIFVISIIATIISTIRDKSHEERQNQKPPSTPKENQQPKKVVFSKNLKRHLKNLVMKLMEKHQVKRKEHLTIIFLH